MRPLLLALTTLAGMAASAQTEIVRLLPIAVTGCLGATVVTLSPLLEMSDGHWGVALVGSQIACAAAAGGSVAWIGPMVGVAGDRRRAIRRAVFVGAVTAAVTTTLVFVADDPTLQKVALGLAVAGPVVGAVSGYLRPTALTVPGRSPAPGLTLRLAL